MPPVIEAEKALPGNVSTEDSNTNRKLFAVLYRELRGLAHSAMCREKPGHILQTTALINEAYMNLSRRNGLRWNDREHFFIVAGRAMRRILVNEARNRKAAKRGGGLQPLSIDDLEETDQLPVPPIDPFGDLEGLDLALQKMGSEPGHERICQVVELRFFAGLSHAEAAEVLKVSRATVRNDWEFAKAWLYEEMKGARSK